MDKFCRECGAQLEADMKFCANCGVAVEANRHKEADGNNPYSRQQLIHKRPDYVAVSDNEEPGCAYEDSLEAEAAACEPESQLKHIPAVYNFFEKFSIGRWLNHTVYVTDGRINRWAYFKNSLLLALLNFVVIGAGMLVFCIQPTMLASDIVTIVSVVALILFAIFLIPGSYMLGIRRLHDLNRAGWLVLLFFLPYVNISLAIYLLFFKGTDGANQYGEDPLAEL